MILYTTRLLKIFAVLLLLSACSQAPDAIKGVTHINNDELAALLDKGATLIDIRRREEWRQTGVVKGSKMITLFNAQGKVESDFVPRLQRLVKKDQPFALICRTGNRSRAAAEMLSKQLGYSKIYNVTNGITQWIKENRPVVGISK